MTSIRELAQQYLAYAVTEPGRSGQPRSDSTLSSFRRAVEGFVAAAEALGIDTLDKLPESFIENEWMQTQKSVLSQSIQLKVRVSAVRRFTQWAEQQGFPCAVLRFPIVQTPKKEHQEMSDMTYLADPAQGDPVPSSQATSSVAMPTAVPPPPPQRPTATKPTAGRHPLAHMFPSNGHRLRVRRERELGQDPVWMGDYPADRVMSFGAIEPFLGREVGMRFAQAGVTGDVTLLVTPVTPKGEELETLRITIAIPALPTAVQSIAAPVAGAPVVVPMPTGSPAEQVTEVLAASRRAQEELEERLMKKLEARQQQEATPRVEQSSGSGEMAEMRSMMATLAQSVHALAQRMEDREERVMTRPEPAPVAPQLDMLGVLREVVAMSKPPPAPPAPPAPGPEMWLGMMAQAKSLFAPANVNIDVSPLEEAISDIRKELHQKPKGVTEMVSEFKALKELFTVVGGETSASKPTGLGAALGNFITKVADNPEPFAMGLERVVTAVRAGPGGPSQPTQPSTQQTTESSPLQAATKTLLDASGPEAVVVAAHGWMRMLASIPQTAKIAERISDLVRKGVQAPLAAYLRQVFAHLGFQLTPERVTAFAGDLLVGIKAANAQAAEGDEDEGEEEGDEEGEGEGEEDGEEEAPQAEVPPDLVVRVGGVHADEQSDEESEDGDEEKQPEDDDGDEDESDEEPEDEEPEYDPEEEEAKVASSEPPEAIDARTVEVTETKSQQRKRRRAEREAAEAANREG